MTDTHSNIIFREEVEPADPETVRRLCRSSGFFTPAEVDVADELVRERLARGQASGYEFVFAQLDGETVGYACFGPIACTVSGWDLYWIVVDDTRRGLGLGSRLLDRVEDRVAAMGGGRLYAETSSQPAYAATRAFYAKRGFRIEARMKDFYASGDDKVVYGKPVPRSFPSFQTIGA